MSFSLSLFFFPGFSFTREPRGLLRDLQLLPTDSFRRSLLEAVDR